MKKILWLVLILYPWISIGQYAMDATQKNKQYLVNRLFEQYNNALHEERLKDIPDYLFQLKQINASDKDDTLAYYILSDQCEFYYYSGLTQFANTSAKEALTQAKKINDSACIADALAYGSYIYEAMDSIDGSLRFCQQALWSYPTAPRQRYFQLIRKEQIINQLAQLFTSQQQYDSALLYNRLAYQSAIRNQAKRAECICLATFAKIYAKTKSDSAHFYYILAKSESQQEKKMDITLWNETNALDIYTSPAQIETVIREGIAFANKNTINATYYQLFLNAASTAAERIGNYKLLGLVHNNQLQLNKSTKGDYEKTVAEISSQMLVNEEKLHKNDVLLLNHKRKILVFQLISLALASTLGFLIYYLYNKKKNQKLEATIIYQKETQLMRDRIAQDLHDDIGGLLNRINYVAMYLPQSTAASEDLKKINTLSEESVEKINDFIWSLNESNTNTTALHAHLKNFVSATPLSLITQGPEIKLSTETSRTVLIIVKEMMQWLQKQKDAGTISIITTDTKKINIILQSTTTNSLKNSNELLSWKRRISASKGVLNISDTQLDILLPANEIGLC